MKFGTREIDNGILLLVLLIAAGALAGRYCHIDVEFMQKALARLPAAYSLGAYLVVYVVLSFFVFFAKDILWLAGALLFGPFVSGACITVAETINACILFYVARSLGRAFVDKSLSGKYRHLDARLGNINFAWLFCFRVAPLVAFRFLDLAAGLSRISFKKYMGAVLLGSWLRIFWIQYILAAVGKGVLTDPTVVAGYYLRHPALLGVSLIYFVCIVAVAIKLKDLKEKL